MLILLKFIFSRNKLIILSRPKMESIKSEAYLLGPCQTSMMKFSGETNERLLDIKSFREKPHLKWLIGS